MPRASPPLPWASGRWIADPDVSVVLDVARLAQALAPVFAAWACLAALAAARFNHQGLVASARRGLVAAALLASLALVGIVTALVWADLGVRIVAAQSSLATPVRFTLISVFADGGASQLVVAVGVAIAILVATSRRAAPRSSGHPALLLAAGTAAGGLVVAVATAGAAIRFDPLGRAALTGEGAGLDPALHTAAAGVMGLGFALACIASTARFATMTVAGAFNTDDSSGPWHRRGSAWSAVAWASLATAGVAGVRWAAHMPSIGPWWSGDALAAWIVPLALATGIVARERSDGEHREPVRMALDGALLATCLAAWAVNGAALVRAPRSAAETSASWLAPLALAVAGFTVWRAWIRPAGAAAPAQGTGQPRAGIAYRASSGMAFAGAILVIGAAAGAAFAVSIAEAVPDTGRLRATDPFGHEWTFTSQGTSTFQRENYSAVALAVIPVRDGARLPIHSTEVRSYLRWDREAARPGVVVLTSGIQQNVFLEARIALDAIPERGAPPRVRVTFVPLAPWLVPGVGLLVAAVLLRALVPGARAPEGA